MALKNRSKPCDFSEFTGKKQGPNNSSHISEVPRSSLMACLAYFVVLPNPFSEGLLQVETLF
jgi:hypothetical protein